VMSAIFVVVFGGVMAILFSIGLFVLAWRLWSGTAAAA
jgi:hypothetical protein